MFNIQPFEELASHNCGRIDSKGFCLPIYFSRKTLKILFLSVFIQHAPHEQSICFKHNTRGRKAHQHIRIADQKVFHINFKIALEIFVLLFSDNLESFWTVWKVSGKFGRFSRHSGKFIESLESRGH